MPGPSEITPELYRRLTAALSSQGYNHASRTRESAPLSRIFNYNLPVPAAALSSSVLAALRPFADAGIVDIGDAVESHVRVVPLHDSWILVDSPRRYRHQTDRYSYIGDDGMMLLDFARPRLRDVPRDAAILDLCAGSGMIGIELARTFADVTCADIHGPALEWATRNRAINEVDVKIVQSDLFAGTAGPYRVILANPSYSFYPDEHVKKTGMIDYETGGAYGLELTDRILSELDARLTTDGDAFVCTVDPTVRGRSLLTEHLHEILGGHDYAVELHHVYRARNKFVLFEDFYRGLGISDLQFVIVHARRGVPASFRDVPLPRVRDFIDGVRGAVLRNSAYRRARRLLRGR